MVIRDLIISEEATIIQALAQLDKTAKKVLFVAREDRLVAALTDGDIRRLLLSNGNLQDHVDRAANYHPVFIASRNLSEARKLMSEKKVAALPVVDDKCQIVDVVFSDEKELFRRDDLNNVPVVIMAGGQGTRLYPYTKILPKPLIPIGDIPISEHIINRFYNYGCNNFYFIVNYKKNMIKAYYNEIDKDYTVNYVDEDIPLGTGGGVGLLNDKINSTFVLTNCDTLIDDDFSKIIKTHKEKKNIVTMVCSLRNYEVPYGVVNIGENGTIESMQEKPQMSFFTNTGTYIVEPDLFELIKPDQRIDFPDVIQAAKDAGLNVGVYPINEKSWLDMGQFDSMEDMKLRLNVID